MKKAQGFSIKKPGTYTVKIPTSFFFTAIDQDGGVIAGEARLDQGHQVTTE